MNLQLKRTGASFHINFINSDIYWLKTGSEPDK